MCMLESSNRTTLRRPRSWAALVVEVVVLVGEEVPGAVEVAKED